MLEMVTPVAKEQKGLYHSNLVAVFDLPERRDALAARVESCVSRAFHAIGSSSETSSWSHSGSSLCIRVSNFSR